MAGPNDHGSTPQHSPFSYIGRLDSAQRAGAGEHSVYFFYFLVFSLTSSALLHNGNRANSTGIVKSTAHKSYWLRIPYADVTTQGYEVGCKNQVDVVALVAIR